MYSTYAIAGINQQLRDEAEFALFSDTAFVAEVGSSSVWFLSKFSVSTDWDRFEKRLSPPVGAWGVSVTVARRIRNIKVRVQLAHML